MRNKIKTKKVRYRFHVKPYWGGDGIIIFPRSPLIRKIVYNGKFTYEDWLELMDELINPTQIIDIDL